MHGKHLIYYSKPQCGRAGFLPKSNRCALYYICCCSVAKSCPTLLLQHTRLPCPSLSPRVDSFMSIESVMPSNHLLLCRPLLLLPSVFPNIRVFSNELALCIRWPKYWSFSFNISLSNEHSGLISYIAIGDRISVQTRK